MRMTVSDLMCETPVTISARSSCDQALEAFFEYETPELYVVDAAGRFLGVLPDYELIKAQLSGEAQNACVEQLMSSSIRCFTPGTDAADVARLFRDSSCSRVPVVKSGRLVGVVTRSDVLRLMAVLRRIDPPVVTKTEGPKRPKMMDRPKTAATRTSRAKSVSPKPATSRSRAKVANRSSRSSSKR